MFPDRVTCLSRQIGLNIMKSLLEKTFQFSNICNHLKVTKLLNNYMTIEMIIQVRNIFNNLIFKPSEPKLINFEIIFKDLFIIYIKISEKS